MPISFPIGSIPAALALALLVARLPLPKSVQRAVNVLKSPFEAFIPLEEAEISLRGEGDATVNDPATRSAAPLWRTVVLSWVALLESLIWLGIACYRIIVAHDIDALELSEALAISASWLYAALKPILVPTPTVPYGLFLLYTAHLAVATVFLASPLYDYNVDDRTLPPTWGLIALASNITLILLLLTVVVHMPLAVPRVGVRKEDIGVSVSPEEYTSLWKWLTFDWVRPLVQRGRRSTLNEEDVWNLSPTMRARVVFAKFQQIQQTSIVYRLWRANSQDFLMDFILTWTTVVCNYAGPFFLKKILSAIEDGPRESLSRAFVFACLSFLAHVLKGESELQHLWYGRRAATRLRTELQAAIYEKALKRKDYSGVVPKDKQGSDTSADNKDGEKPKAGAGIGKIVNLMSSDVERIVTISQILFYIYSAPFEIALGAVFLYELLGWSAFSGFIAFVLAFPVSRWLTQRAVRMRRDLSAAQDKRASAVNELIGAVRFIKFFAWEGRWINRVMEARKNELYWIRRGRINVLLFHALYVLSPVLITLISFFTYVALGNQLNVSTAFTALALYAMIRDPMNIIPIWLLQIADTTVALRRIETYLNEDEVDGGVSSLEEAGDTVAAQRGLAIIEGTFKWNEVEQSPEVVTAQARDHIESTNEGTGETDVQSNPDLSTTGDHDFRLRDIDVTFPEGKLTLITGPTACGKTALLMALLGEMTILSGRISLPKDTSKIDSDGLVHAISYASQSPWLRHQSIKDNILFGHILDQKRYEAVVEACALKPDFEILEDGDATEIGAGGISLSGGQKARVALARAVYAPTKYVLLDDPLSAVDSHTARHIFERLLCGPVLQGRTVLLVTHHVSLVLPGANYVVRLSDGRIDLKGTVEDLRSQGVLDEVWRDIPDTEDVTVEKTEEDLAKEAEQELVGDVKSDDGNASDRKKPRTLVEEEHREAGSVKWHIYQTYLTASSYWTWAVILLLIALNQVLSISEKLWIKVWGEAYPLHQSNIAAFSLQDSKHQTVIGFGPSMTNAIARIPAIHALTAHISRWPDAQQHPMYYIGIYAAISLGTAFVDVGFVVTQLIGSLRASRLLFERLLVTVVRATMRWHDVTPQGRILNRFTKDMDTVDSSLAQSMLSMNIALGGFLAAVLAVTVFFPVFLIPAALLGFIYFHLAVGYLNTGRDLRRMESNSRSPIFSGFQELLQGIVTVRAFSAERRFLQEFLEKMDLTTKMWYAFWMTNRWLSFNFDLLGASAVFVTTLLSLTQYVSAGVAGLCITSAMTFSDRIYWACRYWTALELDLNSVERVVEYLDVPQEPPAFIESNRPPAYWPSSHTSGTMLSVEDLVVKYARDLPPVLHGISFSLKPGERVGLLGRTGSGKSTLAMSLLRFVDPVSGRIVIDGIDISTIGLHDLRSRITFIPQDAALFSGTLRENLDPFNEHSDEECTDVLHRVHMISKSAYNSRVPSRRASVDGTEAEAPVASGDLSPEGTTIVDRKTAVNLETQVSSGGANFSQGQRQLIALARAMLRRSSMIILDEATSSIDFDTDEKIQQTIREEFGGALLLTVAHRLRTVIDYDRLIVLDNGRIAEFDTPYALIKKEDGIFRHMCLRSGMFAELETMAKGSAE
ncbi:P-loop containing nucleoside triphosphate hydrolase protein [Heliocybe sulcata]|uniref:P-loop containing nucleoside triphosphate hydrolase protein n=1 Tax=Heliocybe sulcata TaxID=5364 RepID=A0A5C3N2E5_9AGAM|nr:P-loop containing nucleoside triphosphate hydrolase protein [Heliocybe sulcata]